MMLLSRKVLSSVKKLVFISSLVIVIWTLFSIHNRILQFDTNKTNSSPSTTIGPTSTLKNKLAVIIPLNVYSFTIFSTFITRLKRHRACSSSSPSSSSRHSPQIDLIILPNANWKTLDESLKSQIQSLIKLYTSSNQHCFANVKFHSPRRNRNSTAISTVSQQLFDIFDSELLETTYDGFLWLEPELVPVKQNWVDEFTSQFYRSTKVNEFWIQGTDVSGSGNTSEGLKVPHMLRTGIYSLLNDELKMVIRKTKELIDPTKNGYGLDEAMVKVLQRSEFLYLLRNQSSMSTKFQSNRFIHILNDSATIENIDQVMKSNTESYFVKAYDDGFQSSSTKEVPIQNGLSIFTAVKNRNDIINVTLPTWYNAYRVNEIVIVDWSSDPPLLPIIEYHRSKSPIPIHLITVPNQPKWILSHAFNLAAKHTKYDKIFKVDSDTLLDPQFLVAHQLRPNAYFAGNWRLSFKYNDLNMRHLNGVCYFYRNHFVDTLNGYDERITTYGWDDDNLYDRASENGLVRYEFKYGMINHYSHPDALRSLGQCTECETAINKAATKLIPNWSPKYSSIRCVNWDYAKVSSKLVSMRPSETKSCTDLISHPSSLRHYFTDSEWNRIVISGITNVLKWRTKIPHPDLDSINHTSTAAVLSQIYNPESPTRYFVIHVQHGLGNRIRTYVSGKAIARNSGRKLIVIWEPDVHCFAEFYDIFDGSPNSEEIVLKEFNINWFKEENVKLFNYFTWEGGIKNELINASIPEHIYAKSSSQLVSTQSSRELENSMLKSFKYSKPVNEIIQSWLTKRNFTKSKIEKEFVGVHIRMETNIFNDVKDLSKKEVNVMKEAIPYRSKCHYSAFVRQLMTYPTDTKFFIAIDKTEELSNIQEKFPGRIESIERGNCGVARNLECVQYGMADMVVLGWTRTIVGSRWSSFSEVAGRLNKKGNVVVAC
ncbi:hypothetical protein BKA69DRAFT_1068427 [Paraphysoderma sedebokerense]|nr:hypothetical protein BKA69DRAFT_1068427 [Paraphysoderma sedebokerense]